MSQRVFQPTQLDAILGICLAPNDDSISDSKVHDTFSDSDHWYLTLCINIPDNSRKKKFTYRDYEGVDYDLPRAHLATIDWNSLFSE